MLKTYVTRTLVALAALVLAGCMETSQSGLREGAKTNFARVALVTDLSDAVASSYWPSAFSEPRTTEGRLGWDAAASTESFVTEQLVPAGATVRVAGSHTSAAARSSDVVLVLQQTPLDKLGQNYNPGRDFFALGGGLFAIAAVADTEEHKEQRYKPRFVLWVRNPAVSKGLIGENACTVGLTASLLDPATGRTVREGVQVSGRSIIPGALSAPAFAAFSKEEKSRTLTHCRLALRSAVAQAVVKLNIAG